MNCPECNSERIEARDTMRKIYDAREYRLTCLDCGETWGRRRGLRRRPEPGTVNEWANVTFVGRVRAEVPPLTKIVLPRIKGLQQWPDPREKEKP